MNASALKFTTILLAALVLLTGWGLVAHTADNTTPLTVSDSDVVLGDEDAPLTIIEYASMTCGHCADFHNKVLPEIKENYIEPGKVKFVLRDMPWDPLALAVSKITRCAPDDQFYSYTSAFFDTHQAWVRADDPVAELKKVARLGGMSADRVEECLNDADIHARVIQSRETGLETLRINSTPTFFVGGEEVVRGNVGYEKMANVIDKVLARGE